MCRGGRKGGREEGRKGGREDFNTEVAESGAQTAEEKGKNTG
jgi:hypothetical protein